MYKGKKETTNIEVGERNIHPHIEKNKYNVCVKTVTRPNVQEQCIYKRRKISTMYVQKRSQDPMYKNSVSIKEEKKRKDT